jgi:hypothetical protein
MIRRAIPKREPMSSLRRAAAPVVVLADKPHDEVENPSVAVGPDGELLVTSAACFGTHPRCSASSPTPHAFTLDHRRDKHPDTREGEDYDHDTGC